MNDYHKKSVALALLTFVFAYGSSIARIANAAELARDNDRLRKRFTVPGPVAVSLAEEYLGASGVDVHYQTDGEKAGSNAVYCPGRGIGETSFCDFYFLRAKRGSTECANVNPGWKVIDVRINGSPKVWISRPWRYPSSNRCLTTRIQVRHTNSSPRNFSLGSVVLEGPPDAKSFREAFDR